LSKKLLKKTYVQGEVKFGPGPNKKSEYLHEEYDTFVKLKCNALANRFMFEFVTIFVCFADFIPMFTQMIITALATH